MSNGTATKKILSTLRKRISRNADTSFKKLAQDMNISISTLQRLLRGQGATLERLEDIASLLNVGLFELVQEAENERLATVFLEEEQEKYFLEDVKAYWLYSFIACSFPTQEKLRIACKDDPIGSENVLYQLHQVSLIEYFGDFEYKLKNFGVPRFRPGGIFLSSLQKGHPLVESLREEYHKIVDLLMDDYHTDHPNFLELQLTEEQAEDFLKEISELRERYNETSIRNMSQSTKASKYLVSFGMKKVESNAP